jgi:hypothetical protein
MMQEVLVENADQHPTANGNSALRAMSDQTPPRQMFPDSRFILGLFSPIIAVFFGVCFYFVREWRPTTIIDKIGKFAVEDILVTFITLCGVGLIAAIVGPQRIQPLIRRIGSKAILAALALILGTIVYIIYCSLSA